MFLQFSMLRDAPVRSRCAHTELMRRSTQLRSEVEIFKFFAAPRGEGRRAHLDSYALFAR